MTCRHVRHLHDAYLDAELSESQMAEVHAHLLQCPECQREVELVRACGDVIRMDDRVPSLSSDFTDTLLARLPSATRRSRRRRIVARIATAAPLAAAACLAAAVWLGRSDTAQSPMAENDATHVPPAVVAGESRYITDVFHDALNQIQPNFREIGRMADGVRGFCRRTLEDAEQEFSPVQPPPADPTADEATFVSELMRPFFDLFDPPVHVLPATADDIERF